MADFTTISDCAAVDCAFNDNHGCKAAAITVGAKDSNCTTFIALNTRGGLPVASAHVGACQRTECTHNESLLCGAKAITLSGSTAHCESFNAR